MEGYLIKERLKQYLLWITYVWLPFHELFQKLSTHKAKGRIAAPNRMNFGKVLRGGVIFNPKIFVADLGNLKQGFLSMKLIQNSNFRVQGMFFNNCIVLHLSLEIMYMHFILSYVPVPPCTYATISIMKNLQYNFLNEGGRGQRPFGFFPKICLICQCDPSLSPISCCSDIAFIRGVPSLGFIDQCAPLFLQTVCLFLFSNHKNWMIG